MARKATCSRATWKVNRSSSSDSGVDVVTLKRRTPSRAASSGSASMVPRSAISLNRSTRLSACEGLSSGPTRNSTVRWPSVGAASVAAGAAGAATAAGCTGAGLGAATAATGAWPDTIARMLTSSSEVSMASAPEPWWRPSMALSASPDCSSTSTIGAVGVSSWRRSLSSSVSIWWVSSATSLKPNVAAPPLMEWAQRKMALSSSSSADSMSSSSRSCSMFSRFSPASSKKTW